MTSLAAVACGRPASTADRLHRIVAQVLEALGEDKLFAVAVSHHLRMVGPAVR